MFDVEPDQLRGQAGVIIIRCGHAPWICIEGPIQIAVFGWSNGRLYSYTNNCPFQAQNPREELCDAAVAHAATSQLEKENKKWKHGPKERARPHQLGVVLTAEASGCGGRDIGGHHGLGIGSGSQAVNLRR